MWRRVSPCSLGGSLLARTLSTSDSQRSRASADYYNQTKEDEEDKVLEDEEFASLRSEDGDEYMPIAHRLAHKADALDTELQRLRYVLCHKPQFVVDTAAATVRGRPTSVRRVLELLKEQRAAEKAAATSPPPAAAASAAAASRGRHSGGQGSRREDALRSSPYCAWAGTSDPLSRFLSRHVFWRAEAAAAAAAQQGAGGHHTALATLDADLDYLRRSRALHQLNYYSRLNLVPKRHIGLAVYQVLWNFVVAAQNACGCVVYGVLRGVKEEGMLKGGCTGALRGLGKAMLFLGYGFVLSPLLHITRGLCNSLYGPVNSVTGSYMFDALSGRWMRCTVADTVLFRHELQREKRVLRTIGRAEFRRKRMQVENKWATRLASMGFSVEMLTEKFKAGSGSKGGSGKKDERTRSPYEVLQVRRTASAQEVKKQYKKLAMVFHPDVAQSRSGGSLTAEEKAATQQKFEEISNAYQILSNPEKRKAYDMGGAQGVHMHESKHGKFMSRTPEEMVQSIFGGEGFRRLLIGELHRSHWSLRYEAQVSVSVHEFEELQCIRVRQVAMELAAIADVHAQRPTAPYHGNSGGGAGSGATAAAAHAGTVGAQTAPRRAGQFHGGMSSSLPDYLKSGKAKSRAGGAGGGLGSRSSKSSDDATSRRSVLGKEMHDTIMEELGGGGGGGGGTANSSGTRASTGGHGAEAATAASPFVLHPGSNEFNCFSKDFEDRCDKLVRRLADACFGKQLLYEVGEAYVVHAQRFLGIRPFYASKVLVTRKIFTGMDRVAEAFKDKTRLSKEQVAHKMAAEYFNMEYDTVVADTHVMLRYALQMVLADDAESEEVRRKRCYAVWLLGEKMMAAGEKWTSRIASDEDLVAYVQQAATSSATTSKPPPF